MIPWWAIGLALAGKSISEAPHPEWAWHTVHTEHFAIHYPTSDRNPDLGAEQAAWRIASEADALWLRMGDVLDWYPSERLDVVVVDDTDGLKAWAWPLRGTVVISSESGVDLYRTRAHGDPLIDVFAHELGHVFLHKRVGTWSERAGYGAEGWTHVEQGPVAVGARIPIGPTLPQWWSEGGAEYLAARVGHGWWSPAREAGLRASVIGDRLLGWDELQVADDKGDAGDGERAYQQGYAFFRWLEAEHGADAFRELNAHAGARARVEPTRALRELTGTAPAELYAAHVADLDLAVTEHLAGRAALGWAEGTELWPWDLDWQPADLQGLDGWEGRSERDQEERRESTGSWNLHPTWSADGRWLGEHRAGWIRVRRTPEGTWPALADHAPSYADTRAQRAADREAELWIPGKFDSTFAFVPGRDAVVVNAPQPLTGWDFDGWDTHGLVLVDLTVEAREGRRDPPDRLRGLRSRATPIPGTDRARDPAVSPDGSQLAWVRAAGGRPALWVARLDGSEARVVADLPAGSWIGHPSWSPEGDRIVAAVHHAHRNDLWVAAVDGSGWTPLTGDPWTEADPDWTEQGILFSADPDGVADIYRLDPDSGAVVQLTRVRESAVTPALTPEGHLLYGARTAFGWKSMGLRRDGWLVQPTDAFVVHPSEALPTVPPVPEPARVRRYSALRALLPVAVAPEARLQLDPSDAGAMGGGWLLARDAAEWVELELHALVGTDLASSGALTWRGLGPELRLWGGYEEDRRWLIGGNERARVFAGAAGLSATVDLAPDRWSVFAEGAWRTLGFRQPAFEDLGQTGLGRLGTRLGDRSHRHAIGVSGADLAVVGTGARSGFTDGSVATWGRAEISAAATGRWGATLLDAHLDAGGTLGDEPPVFAQLRAGGDAPSAERLGVLEASTAFPGFAPRAIAGSQLVVLGGGWSIPVRDLRRRVGPVYLDDLAFRVGGDLGRAWSPQLAGDDPILGDVVGEVRLAAVAGELPWNSVFRVAHGFGEPLATGDPTDARRGEGALRWVLGVGTGW